MHLVIKCGKHSIYRISANFSGFKTVITPEKIYLKDINKQLKNYIVSSIAYNEGRNEYLLKVSNSKILRFNMNFEEINKPLIMKDITKNDNQNKYSLRGFDTSATEKHIGQSIYADCSYIYSVYNVNPNILKNYIAIFDYNGNYVRTIDLSSKIKNTELEELCFYNGVFYIAGTNWINNSFSIFKLNIKNSNKFDISYLDLATKYNEYQTVTIGTEKNTTPLLNINSKADGTSTPIIKLSTTKNRILIGYKAYRDYNNSWRVKVDGKAQWLSSQQITNYKKAGKKVEYFLYKPTNTVYHTVNGGNSVLLTAVWKELK